VFTGQDDWVCDPSMSEIIAEKIPNSTLVVFKNSGHSVPMDEHHAYVKMLRQFITKKYHFTND
jgi:pimeloyl-ACP methyl ester carboxylesterase